MTMLNDAILTCDVILISLLISTWTLILTLMHSNEIVIAILIVIVTWIVIGTVIGTEIGTEIGRSSIVR